MGCDSKRSGVSIAIGAGIGVAIGAGIGAALSPLIGTQWLALGAGMGTAMGAAIGTICSITSFKTKTTTDSVACDALKLGLSSVKDVSEPHR